MTEFKAELRHMCRNPKCRMKLPAPVSNPREAFCIRGCHIQFYRTRCLVCEGVFDRKSERQMVCGKRKCRNGLRLLQKDDFALGRYFLRSTSLAPKETTDFIESKSAPTGDRMARGPAAEHWAGTWSILRVVAGPPMTVDQYRCAIVGAGEALTEAHQVNEAHWRAARAGKQGYRRTDAVATTPVVATHCLPVASLGAGRRHAIPDDLRIPDFLRRYPPQYKAVPDRFAA